MTPVKQRERDDCWRACIASLLDLPPDEVPHWWAGLRAGESVPDYIMSQMRQWFAQRGLYLIDLPFDGEQEEILLAHKIRCPDLRFVLSGRSATGIDHSVICQNGKIVHDPSTRSHGLSGPQSNGYYHVSFIGKLV